MLTKHVVNHTLVCVERDVADKQRVALRARLVTKRLGARLRAFLDRPRLGVVQVDLAAVELRILFSVVGFLGRLDIGEFDIAKSTTVSSKNLITWWDAYPRERPLSRSVTMRTPARSPNDSNSERSHSSSTFHDRLPTKRLGVSVPLRVTLVFSPLFFLAGALPSSSALRFLGAGFASLLSSEDESDSDSSEESSLSSS